MTKELEKKDKASVDHLDLDVLANKYVTIDLGEITYKIYELQVGTFSKVDEMSSRLDAQDKTLKEGKTLTYEDRFDNAVEQAFIILEQDNPDINKDDLSKLPVSVLSKFLIWIKQKMSTAFLGEGLGYKKKETPLDISDMAS